MALQFDEKLLGLGLDARQVASRRGQGAARAEQVLDRGRVFQDRFADHNRGELLLELRLLAHTRSPCAAASFASS